MHLAISLVTKTTCSLVYKRFIGCLVQCLVEHAETSPHYNSGTGWGKSWKGRRGSHRAPEMGDVSTAGPWESCLRAHPSDMELREGGVRHVFHSHTPRMSLYGSLLPSQTNVTTSPAHQSNHSDAVCNPFQPKISKSYPKQEWCVPHPL